VLLVGYLAVTGKLGGITSVSAEGWGWVLLTGVLLAGYVSTWMAALQRAPASAVTAVLVFAAVITTILQSIANGTVPGATSVLGALVLAVAVVAVGIITARRPDVPAGRASARASA
ncbi:MAG: hypothetical protein ABWZ82_00310, partial [Candidatus Limnocylindrales bacterium]